MPIVNDGVMVILSSPSGAGKTTLVSLLSKLDNFEISISHTTRKPRPNEIPNKDYFFVNETEFKRLIKNQEFLESQLTNLKFYQLVILTLKLIKLHPPHESGFHLAAYF